MIYSLCVYKRERKNEYFIAEAINPYQGADILMTLYIASALNKDKLQRDDYIKYMYSITTVYIFGTWV